MENVDYYRVLGLTRTAEPGAVKEAYRRLAKLRHPDKNPDDPDSTANFQTLNDAYATLSDPHKRRLYDAQLPGLRMKSASQPRPQPRPGRFKPFSSQPSSQPSNQSSNSEDAHSEDAQALRRRQIELSSQLQTLAQRLVASEQDLSSAELEVRSKAEVLGRLKEEHATDERIQGARRGWSKLLRGLSAKQQEERDRKATERKTEMIGIEADIRRLQSFLYQKSELLENIRMSIHDAAKQKATVDHQYEAAMQGDWSRN